jgi:hypothetical protein
MGELEEVRRQLHIANAELKKTREFMNAESNSSSVAWNPRTATYVSLDKMASAMAKIVEEAVKLARR